MCNKFLRDLKGHFNISNRTLRSLEFMGIDSEIDLMTLTPTQISNTVGVGPVTVREIFKIKDFLSEKEAQIVFWYPLDEKEPPCHVPLVVYGYTTGGEWSEYFAKKRGANHNIFESVETGEVILNVKYWLHLKTPQSIREDTQFM